MRSSAWRRLGSCWRGFQREHVAEPRRSFTSTDLSEPGLRRQGFEVRHLTRHAIEAVNAREQAPAEALAGYLSFGEEKPAAGAEHAPHLAQCGHPQIRRQVVQHQAGYHHVEMRGREIKRFGCADSELGVAGPASLAAGVGHHLRGGINTDHQAAWSNRLCEQPRKVARATADIQDSLAGLDASGGDQGLKRGAPSAEEKDIGEGVVETRRAE